MIPPMAETRRRLWLPAALAPLLLLAACGAGKNNDAGKALPPAAVSSAVGANALTLAVTIKDIAFPTNTAIKPGTTVTWTNGDGFQHTVTADSGQSLAFDAKPLDPGGTFSVTFSAAGTFKYHCNIHASMHGVVVVSDQAAGSAATPAPVKKANPVYKY